MKLGIIGTGNMSSALIRGILDSGTLSPEDLLLYNRSQAKIDLLMSDYPNLCVCSDADELAAGADVIMLGVKPDGILPYLKQLTPATSSRQVLYLSIAAGITLAAMETASHPGTPIVRVMPNTPSVIGQGATAWCAGSQVTPDQLQTVQSLLAPSGMTECVPEYQIDAISAIAGSGPAYMYVILDALGEAGVALGLPRERATRFAIECMAGSAALARQSRRHLMALRDDVTSPGGSTIAGLNVLDETGLRHALIKAVKAAHARTREMGT